MGDDSAIAQAAKCIHEGTASLFRCKSSTMYTNAHVKNVMTIWMTKMS